MSHGNLVGIGAFYDVNENLVDAVVLADFAKDEDIRNRKAREFDEGDFRRVYVGPLDPDNLSQKQKERAHWIFYNGIIVPENNEYALVSNGRHIDRIHVLREYDEFEDLSVGEAATRVLMTFGPLEDEQVTPRLAGFTDDSYNGYLGMNTRDGYFEFPLCLDETKYFGKLQVISTNKRRHVIEKVTGPNNEVLKSMCSGNLKGNTAQQLADNLYERMVKRMGKLVVCTAVAMRDFERNEYDIAVRNLHE